MIVWLISYPRSGNTFCRIVVESTFDVEDTYTIHYQDKTDRSLLNKIGDAHKRNDEYIGIARESDNVYFVKSHDLPDKKIDVTKDKCIYIVRDGRNAVASYSHFLRDFSKRTTTVVDIIFGRVMYGSWHNHVKKWLRKLNTGNGIIVRYEDLISNPESVARKISEISGLDAIDGKIPTFDELHSQRPKFFRAGGGQNWKNEFSKHEENLFLICSYDVMMKLDYIKPGLWEKVGYFLAKVIIVPIIYTFRMFSKLVNT